VCTWLYVVVVMTCVYGTKISRVEKKKTSRVTTYCTVCAYVVAFITTCTWHYDHSL